MKLSRLFFFCIIVCLWQAQSYAQQKGLTTLTGDSRTPGLSDPGHPKGGMVVELVHAIVDHMGYRNQTRFLPWKRAVDFAQDPAVFGLFPSSKNLPEIEKFLMVPMPLYEIQLVALVPKSSELKEVKRSNAKHLRTCELLGAVTLKKLGLNVTEVKERGQCIKLFESGRLDFLMSTEAMAKKELAKIPFRVVKDDLDYKPKGFFFVNRSYPQAEELYQKFYASFKELEANGTLAKIRAGYPPI